MKTVAGVVQILVCLALSAPGAARISDIDQTTGRNGKDIVVVFRYDDYCDRSDTETERQIFAAFAKHGLKLTVGVVPFPVAGRFVDTSPQETLELSDEKTAMIVVAIEAGIVEPAQHGYSHQSVRGKWEGGLSEFAGVDYKTQLRKIRTGKEYLERRLGRRMDIFIPSYNDHNVETLKALDEAGFRIIAGGRYGPYVKGLRLVSLPFTCYLHSLKVVVEVARRLPEPQPLIIILFHESDFIEFDKRRGYLTYEDFDDLLAWVAAQPDIRVLTHTEVLEGVKGINTDRSVAFSEFSTSTRWLPPFLIPLKTGIYLPAETARSLVQSGWVFTGVYLLAVLIAASLLVFCACLLVFRGTHLTNILYFAGVAIAFAIFVLAAVRFMSDYKGPLLMTLAVGCVFGGLPAYLRAVKRGRRK